MAKYDKRFTLKCDKQFKDDLAFIAKHYELTMGAVVRTAICIAREELRSQS